MKNSRAIQFSVGIFIVLVVFALGVLAFRVSGAVVGGSEGSYEITAEFDNIGGLKQRGSVSVSGVRIGYVDDIRLDKHTFRAVVKMRVTKTYQLPVDSSASIYTQGLLGANYVSIGPGFEEQNLKNNGVIESTHSALVLENLIGQLIYGMKNSDSKPSEKQEKGG